MLFLSVMQVVVEVRTDERGQQDPLGDLGNGGYASELPSHINLGRAKRLAWGPWMPLLVVIVISESV